MADEEQRICWYKDVQSTPVDWLWYPYIPLGKISLIQGDPGDGKSTMLMDLIARLTTGREMPDGKALQKINVIYQCSEDGISDTIKPRLENAGADCSRVGYIKEDILGLTLDDEEMRTAIIQMKANLLVIDPFQAYLGDADMSSAVGMRRIMRRLNIWATAYNCAIVLVGHLNKRAGSKEIYRGLGSIDLAASARSVIQIERDENNPSLRTVKHIKSNLAQNGSNLSFAIESSGKVVWHPSLQFYDNYDLIGKSDMVKIGKVDKAIEIITSVLAKGPVEATTIEEITKKESISWRTAKYAKDRIGAESYKQGKKWFWSLPQ